MALNGFPESLVRPSRDRGHHCSRGGGIDLAV